MQRVGEKARDKAFSRSFRRRLRFSITASAQLNGIERPAGVYGLLLQSDCRAGEVAGSSPAAVRNLKALLSWRVINNNSVLPVVLVASGLRLVPAITAGVQGLATAGRRPRTASASRSATIYCRKSKSELSCPVDNPALFACKSRFASARCKLRGESERKNFPRKSRVTH